MSGSATAASSNMSNLDTPEDLDQFVQELMDNMVRRTEKRQNYYFVLSVRVAIWIVTLQLTTLVSHFNYNMYCNKNHV